MTFWDFASQNAFDLGLLALILSWQVPGIIMAIRGTCDCACDCTCDCDEDDTTT